LYTILLTPTDLQLTFLIFILIRLTPRPTLFPYTTLFRSLHREHRHLRLVAAIHGASADGRERPAPRVCQDGGREANARRWTFSRSEEHTSELQSHLNLVCRLLLEKKKKKPEYEHKHERSI